MPICYVKLSDPDATIYTYPGDSNPEQSGIDIHEDSFPYKDRVGVFQSTIALLTKNVANKGETVKPADWYSNSSDYDKHLLIRQSSTGLPIYDPLKLDVTNSGLALKVNMAGDGWEFGEAGGGDSPGLWHHQLDTDENDKRIHYGTDDITEKVGIGRVPSNSLAEKLQGTTANFTGAVTFKSDVNISGAMQLTDIIAEDIQATEIGANTLQVGGEDVATVTMVAGAQAWQPGKPG